MQLMRLNILTSTRHPYRPNLATFPSWKKATNTIAGNFMIERLRYLLRPRGALWGAGLSKVLADRMQVSIMATASADGMA